MVAADSSMAAAGWNKAVGGLAAAGCCYMAAGSVADSAAAGSGPAAAGVSGTVAAGLAVAALSRGLVVVAAASEC